MKMNDYNELQAYRLDKFSYKDLEWNFPDDDVEVQVECLERNVILTTNNNDMLVAQEYCGLYRLLVNKKPKSGVAKTMTVYTEKHPIVQRIHESIKTDYDFSYNCFGAAALGKKYWLTLSSNNLTRFLDGDGYREAKKQPKRGHLVVYYKCNIPIHIARYDDIEKVYEHKIGNLSKMRYYPTDNIKKYYSYDCKKYFVKG